MKIGMFGLIGAAALATVANADFTGYSVERITLGNGHIIMNVYADFSNTGDRVVNVYRSAITNDSAGGFFQSAANPFWQPGTQNKLTSDDSWVSIDTNPSGSNNASASVTAGDPNFVNFTDLNESTDFSFIQSAGNGAGWYNSQPATQWGFANDGHVLLAHFVAAGATEVNDKVTWSVRLTVTLQGQTGSTGDIGMGTFNFAWIVPGPGALALLGVAGLSSRRRRA